MSIEAAKKMALECREKYEQAFETTALEREVLEALFAYAYQSGHVAGVWQVSELLNTTSVSNPTERAVSDVPRETPCPAATQV